jgi:hypothetical protein
MRADFSNQPECAHMFVLRFIEFAKCAIKDAGQHNTDQHIIYGHEANVDDFGKHELRCHFSSSYVGKC